VIGDKVGETSLPVLLSYRLYAVMCLIVLYISLVTVP
jgi:hypothetical protein